MPNFTPLDMSLPEVAILVAAMVQPRDAVSRRSWSHPQEPTGEEWWADVLADPRARRRERRTDLAVKQAFYRLADEKREIILVACSKCDWRAAFSRDDLIATHGADGRLCRAQLHWRLGQGGDHGRMARVAEAWDRSTAPSATSRTTISSASVRLQRLRLACRSGARLIPILASRHGRARPGHACLRTDILNPL